MLKLLLEEPLSRKEETLRMRQSLKESRGFDQAVLDIRKRIVFTQRMICFSDHLNDSVIEEEVKVDHFESRDPAFKDVRENKTMMMMVTP